MLRGLAWLWQRSFAPMAVRAARHGKAAIRGTNGWPGRCLHALRAVAWLGCAALGLLALYSLALVPFTPSIADLKKQKADQPSVLMSADGKRLAVFARMNRQWVPLARISPNVTAALIATEDHRFYQHHGIDLRRTAAVAARAIVGGSEGGSTITQQLARNLYPEEIGRDRTLTRKIKEVITALKIEQSYSKQEILETYLNTVPFLYNAFGIEMAARTYFDKSAARLSVVESAALIGMLKGTSYYNPVLNPERALRRRNVVLAQMRKREVLTQADFELYSARPIRLDFERQEVDPGLAPHFAEQVRRSMIDWADRNNYNLYSDGLIITTGIDSQLQAYADQAVQRQLDLLQSVADVEWGLDSERLVSTSAASYAGMRRRVSPFGYFWKQRSSVVDAFVRESTPYRNALDAGTAPALALAALRSDRVFMETLRNDKTRLQTGFVALDPRNGQIRAWVGSRDFSSDQYDHVVRAQRQPGSTFKPFVYGAALERGMSPERSFIDQAIDIRVGRNEVWRPTDLTPASGKPMSMREGLMYSKNTITAQVMQEVGPQRTIDFARRLGVDRSKLDAVPALALGVSPVTPLEMVSAYGAIASSGIRHDPVYVTRIADHDGHVLAEFASPGSQAISAQTSAQLVDMLRGVVRQGTGGAVCSRFGLRGDLAGKTGTTQNNTDGWFILMHPQLVAGSWVGFNDTRVTMRSSYWGQGAHNALFVVGDFFQHALKTRALDGNARFAAAPQDNSLLARFQRQFDGFSSSWFDAWSGRGASHNAPVVAAGKGASVSGATPMPARPVQQPETGNASVAEAAPLPQPPAGDAIQTNALNTPGASSDGGEGPVPAELRSDELDRLLRQADQETAP
ncbi:MAG: penicillin-binding protein 1A [Janthinobacterium lividum]